jgi:hypothetical protein
MEAGDLSLSSECLRSPFHHHHLFVGVSSPLDTHANPNTYSWQCVPIRDHSYIRIIMKFHYSVRSFVTELDLPTLLQAFVELERLYRSTVVVLFILVCCFHFRRRDGSRLGEHGNRRR